MSNENISQKTVTVEIATDDLSQLKNAEYKLCFAKNVNDQFNVVWQSYANYLAMNQFSWTQQFELFASNTFQNNVEVKTVTNIEACDLGFSCTLNEAGVLEPQVSGGRETCLTFKNDFGSIHPGANQVSTGLDGNTAFTPIYVTEKAIIKGYDELIPKEIVRIWFQQNIKTGVMIDNISSQSFRAVSYAIDLDLTNTDSKSCLFQNGEWKIV